MSIIEERLALLDTLVLDAGAHDPDGKFCVMEAVAYIAGEPWSDSPECVSPVIASFLRSWNDSLGDVDRQMLKPYVVKVIGTRTTKRDEEKRAWMATDWLVRECAPAFLRLAGLTEHAEALEGLAPLTTASRAKKAQPKLAAARGAARAAAARARAAAARAGAAAGAAAGDAAWSAARAAAARARAAAARAGAAAARAGAARAGAAAGAALEPTVKQLQASALLLLDRMIEVGK